MKLSAVLKEKCLKEMMGRDRHACLMPMGIVTDGQTRGETGGGGLALDRQTEREQKKKGRDKDKDTIFISSHIFVGLFLSYPAAGGP